MTDELLECGLDFITGGLIGSMGWFFGGKDGFMMVLLAFMVVDQCSGIAAGWVEHKLSSNAGFHGILKKCVMFLLVGVAHLMDKYVLGGTEALKTAVCMFYIGNEGISIIENADKLGLPFPEYFRDHFLNMKKMNEKKENEKEKKTKP